MEDRSMGWLADPPDYRDYTANSTDADPPAGQTENVYELLSKVGVTSPEPEDKLAAKIDLRDGFAPIEDQGALGSCTANAAAGVLEYFSGERSVVTSTPLACSSTRRPAI